MIFDNERLLRIASQRHEGHEIDALVAQRDRFLSEHPELRALQEEIDALLATTLDPIKRLDILFMLISERLDAMRSSLGEAFEAAGRVCGSLTRDR
ncbi:MAG TPA: hypothetical protein PLS81_02045 [Deltaproteobacteria bacterium]|nr:hypothetical protein [Deltaproteobacteria bacterium]HOM28224.1 hypothetical protein [Deltaproteobacteria bacterium]HPP80804.1 hypothetical protein [Deltaproteobacteria bacterium]